VNDSRPAEARCAEAVVLAIRALVGSDDENEIRTTAVHAGLRPGHLRRVVTGLEPPDLVIIARLEASYGVRIWPGP
jgi:hypothetical protein